MNITLNTSLLLSHSRPPLKRNRHDSFSVLLSMKTDCNFSTQHMLTSLDELSNDYDGNRNQNFEDADDLSDKHKSLAHYINATTVVSHRVMVSTVSYHKPPLGFNLSNVIITERYITSYTSIRRSVITLSTFETR